MYNNTENKWKAYFIYSIFSSDNGYFCLLEDAIKLETKKKNISIPFKKILSFRTTTTSPDIYALGSKFEIKYYDADFKEKKIFIEFQGKYLRFKFSKSTFRYICISIVSLLSNFNLVKEDVEKIMMEYKNQYQQYNKLETEKSNILEKGFVTNDEIISRLNELKRQTKEAENKFFDSLSKNIIVNKNDRSSEILELHKTNINNNIDDITKNINDLERNREYLISAGMYTPELYEKKHEELNENLLILKEKLKEL